MALWNHEPLAAIARAVCWIRIRRVEHKGVLRVRVEPGNCCWTTPEFRGLSDSKCRDEQHGQCHPTCPDQHLHSHLLLARRCFQGPRTPASRDDAAVAPSVTSLLSP